MSTQMANKFMNFAIITPDDQQQLQTSTAIKDEQLEMTEEDDDYDDEIEDDDKPGEVYIDTKSALRRDVTIS